MNGRKTGVMRTRQDFFASPEHRFGRLRGLDEQGLPLGLHLIGRELDEQGVLNAGLAIEERAGFTAKPKRWW